MGTPTGGTPSSVVQDILGKLLIAFTICYPSRVFIGDNNMHQLTMLSNYNYGDARLKGLTWVKAVNILVDHVLFNA